MRWDHNGYRPLRPVPRFEEPERREWPWEGLAALGLVALSVGIVLALVTWSVLAVHGG